MSLSLSRFRDSLLEVDALLDEGRSSRRRPR